MSDQVNRASRRDIVRRYRGKYRSELVPLPEFPDDDGEPTVVEVRSLLGHDRADHMTAIAGEANQDGVRQVDWHQVLPMLPFLATYDPDDGMRFFESPEEVMEYDQGAIQRINEVAQRLSGMDQTEEARAGKI